MKTIFLFFALLFNQMNAQILTDEDGAEIREARFAAGSEQLAQYLARNIQYPEKAAIRHIEGVVTVTFTVDTTGDIRDTKVRSGLGLGCDEEALRLVAAMPKWTPAFINGKPVASGKTLRIEFRMPQ